MQDINSIIDQVEIAHKNSKILKSTFENISDWLNAGFLSDWALESINELVVNESWKELDDRFYRQLKFGTGGLRGRTIGSIVTSIEKGILSDQDTPQFPAIGTATFNEFNLVRSTIGLYNYCNIYLRESLGKFDIPKLIVAHDVRHFSRHFCELVASTWTQLGGLALIFDGPRSTPQLSFTVRHLKSLVGVTITASHNPPHDNGYKVTFDDGAQITPMHADGIVKSIEAVNLAEIPQYLNKVMNNVITLPKSVDDDYLSALDQNILYPEVFKNTDLKVIFTSLHGTGSIMSVPLMKKHGIEVIEVEEQAQMDSRFPTVKSPNPEYPETMQLALKKADELNIDIVMGTDPDADRLGIAVRDENGKLNLLTGNMTGSILAEYRISKLKEKGIIPKEGSKNAALIKTFVTTPLQAEIAKKNGLKLIETLTGFKWIVEKLKVYEDNLIENMLSSEGIAIDYDLTDMYKRAELLLKYSTFFVFAGEESYGYLATDLVRDKDANAITIIICELAAELRKQNKTINDYLNDIYLKYGYYYEELFSIKYEGATGSTQMQNFLDTYSNSPPTEIGGLKVTQIKDFSNQDIVDEDGVLLPKQMLFFVNLDNGYTYAARASGTEPKLKFYLYAREAISEISELSKAKQKAYDTCRRIEVALTEDARKRAEG